MGKSLHIYGMCDLFHGRSVCGAHLNKIYPSVLSDNKFFVGDDASFLRGDMGFLRGCVECGLNNYIDMCNKRSDIKLYEVDVGIKLACCNVGDVGIGQRRASSPIHHESL